MYGDKILEVQSDHSTCMTHPSMNARAAQPAPPSDKTYKKVYQTVLNSWRDHPAKECCKTAHHVACQHPGLNCCFAATSVPNEWQEYYCEFHFSGTGVHFADGPLPAFSTSVTLHQCKTTATAGVLSDTLVYCTILFIGARQPTIQWFKNVW
jgi:hypothetical protein